ncbi:ATP-binding cassette domain-containing protein [Herbaspirillum sp. SJZ107]|uniref:ABC transporter ATP-binding protein n=1 Tax=Herbaspirillum sp. SJZ107 TaxID=2572881 RepID=UPI00116C0800|nr:ATP-binding cassette domain-containing protein [Herbaspirillum sp. SJZ107]TQK03377.1 ABC transporter family protein [Herbaspirillum sp. SJZ107]
MLIANNLDLSLPGFSLHVDALRLAPGESVWLQGANGAGKSTLLKSLAGIFMARHTELSAYGHTLADAPIAYKQDVVYAGSLRRAYAHLTAAEVLAFARQFYRGWRRQLEAELAAQLKLPLDVKVKHLSQGMNAKLNFLLAACSGARIFLLDELLAPVDADAKEVIGNFFLGRLAERDALVICSHDDDPLTAAARRRWKIAAGAFDMGRQPLERAA